MSPAATAWLMGTLFWSVAGLELKAGKSKLQVGLSLLIAFICFAVAVMEWFK